MTLFSKTTPLEERLWKRVDKSAGEKGCWIWTGTCNNGYGQIRSFKYGNNGRIYVHKLVFILSGGNLTTRRPLVLHKCHEYGFRDNKACCNPLHLKAGSQKENIHDSIVAGTNYESRRTHCPRGHPLASDNLVASQLRVGRRNCRTCWNQRQLQRNRKVRRA